MPSPAADPTAPPPLLNGHRLLVFGEALVDLICERPLAKSELPDGFTPHIGGAAANLSVAAARLGATVSLAGGAGNDEWGRWIETTLENENVGLDFFTLLDNVQTPVAFALVDPDGEPRFSIYGRAIATVVSHLAPILPAAIAMNDAFVMLSNTLIGDDERAITMTARSLAIDRGQPVCFDPNLRLHRWKSPEDARQAITAVLPDLFLVKCNRDEAAFLTGQNDPAGAAVALTRLGAANAVVTLGPDGALLRSADGTAAETAGVPAQVVNTTGAGDAFFGTLLGHLAREGFTSGVIAANLQSAAKAGARATESWPAIPDPG